MAPPVTTVSGEIEMNVGMSEAIYRYFTTAAVLRPEDALNSEMDTSFAALPAGAVTMTTAVFLNFTAESMEVAGIVSKSTIKSSSETSPKIMVMIRGMIGKL